IRHGERLKVARDPRRKAIKEKQRFERLLVTKENLLEMFKACFEALPSLNLGPFSLQHNKYKVHNINDKIPDGTSTTVYRCGPLIDLCYGPHIPDTGRIKAWAVTKKRSRFLPLNGRPCPGRRRLIGHVRNGGGERNLPFVPLCSPHRSVDVPATAFLRALILQHVISIRLCSELHPTPTVRPTPERSPAHKLSNPSRKNASSRLKYDPTTCGIAAACRCPRRVPAAQSRTRTNSQFPTLRMTLLDVTRRCHKGVPAAPRPLPEDVLVTTASKCRRLELAPLPIGRRISRRFLP
ncbi:hypothetical protein BDK51DRAFT_47429, partial [Blyttiomyces helicus]